MANSTSSNRKVVPAAAEALNKFKYEVASDVGVKKLFKKNNSFLTYTSLATLLIN